MMGPPSSRGTARSELRAVAFDAVGTLIRPRPGVADAYATVAATYGSRLSAAQVRTRFHAALKAREARDLAGDLRTDEEVEITRWRAIVGRVLTDVRDSEGCFEALFHHFSLPDSWEPFPDVASVIERLQDQGVTLAIASNFDSRLRRIAYTLAPLKKIPHVVISSEVGFRKPHPKFFAAILQSVNTPPGNVLVVGDDPRTDVEGARSAGMNAILLDRSRTPRAHAISDLECIPDRVLGRRPGLNRT